MRYAASVAVAAGLLIGAGAAALGRRTPLGRDVDLDAKRAAVEREAARGVATAGRIALWDQHLLEAPDDVEALLARAGLLRGLAAERRAAGDGVGARTAARRALDDLRVARATRPGGALVARLLLAEAELQRVDLADLRAAREAYEALAALPGPLGDYARARLAFADGDEPVARALVARALAASPDLEPALRLRDLLPAAPRAAGPDAPAAEPERAPRGRPIPHERREHRQG